MAYGKITHPRIVTDARKRFANCRSAGDEIESALAKAINGSLLKLWRRQPLDMTNQRNRNRFGDEFAELKRLVLADQADFGCSGKAT